MRRSRGNRYMNANPAYQHRVRELDRCMVFSTVRRVQQLLSEGAEPREAISLGSKRRTGKLRGGDWRGLLKATERRTAQVFGPIEDGKELAAAIRKFAQAIADRHARPGGKLVVSVSVKPPK
jgi:hypothetical protein